MNVGILGSGNVAAALARGFEERGHAVRYGHRDQFADIAAFGELVVLATLGTATIEALNKIDPAAFTGKTVIDATNPILYEESGPRLSIGFTDSLGEEIQRALPTAHVVKAFNTAGHEHMVHPTFAGGPPDMFIAGNDEAAKQTVRRIVEDFGWNCVDFGHLENARLLEQLCMVWVRYGQVTGQWDHAFKLLRK